MLDKITPVILTFNEELNIERTLQKLYWAQEIIVVDSYSTDSTLEKINSFKNVRLFQRKFDSHSQQWEYAIKETDIKTDWVLALDADYVLSDEIIKEFSQLNSTNNVSGYSASFKYLVWGRPLTGTIYPPVVTLYRRDQAEYIQDGHTQRIQVNGPITHLNAKIFHDDRKALSRWLLSQDKYAKLERNFLSEKRSSQLGVIDQIRKFTYIAPFLVFFYCLFVKGCIFNGRAGFFYATQRLLAETLLSLRMIEFHHKQAETKTSKKNSTVTS